MLLSPVKWRYLDQIIKDLVTHNCYQEIESGLTFYQPLWLKLVMIKKKEDLPMTMLLEHFLTQVSYLGSLGYVMKNSGVLESLSTV